MEDIFDNDDIKFVKEVYGKKIADFLGSKDFVVSFFAESEKYADEVEFSNEPSIHLGEYSFSFIQDFSFEEASVLSDLNYCIVDGKKFVKIITPFTRSRSYDFIAAKREEVHEIVKTLIHRRNKSYIKKLPPHIIGIPIREIESKTIDFLLDEELRSFCNERDIPLKRGVIFEGPPGCLSKDTNLLIKSEKDHHFNKYTIEEAYYKFNRIEHGDIKGRRFWDRSKKKFIQSLVNGKIEYREIKSILDSGEKEVFEVFLENGLKIKATKEHPFKIPDENINGRGNPEKDNFVPLGKLEIGDLIYCKNISNEKIYVSKGRNSGRKEILGVKYHPYAWAKKTDNYEYKRIHYSRLVAEANLNNINIEEFINIIKNNEEKAKKLKYLSGDFVVHHKDENVLNDNIENLEVLTKYEHDKHHAKNEYFSDTLPALSKVLKIEKVGIEKTFDIVMEGESKNFLANNIIVHNTGKSMTLKYLRTKADNNDIEFEVFNDIKEFMDNSDDYYRNEKKIFVFEDFDTALLDRDNTNGTPNQILGKILNTLDGVREIDNVVSIFTTNKVKLFDDAFIRPGRIDTVFTFGLPSDENIREFVEKYLFDFDKEHIFETIMTLKSNANVSFAFLKGISDDMNIYKFFAGKNPDRDKTVEIIRERMAQTNKGDEKQTSDFIL